MSSQSVAIVPTVRGRDGIEAQARTTWLFTVRNGKLERGSLYQNKQEALAAARLAG
jgi:hypothetical protein